MGSRGPSGAPSCGVHVRLPPVGHRRGSAVRQPQHLRMPTHHFHRMRRRFRPNSPEEQDFFHPGGDHCAGARPRSSVSETHCRGRRERSKHMRVPAFKNTTKIQRESPTRGRKNENCGGRGTKKREILGPPPFGAPPLGAPPFVVQKFNIQKLAEVEIGRSRPRSGDTPGETPPETPPGDLQVGRGRKLKVKVKVKGGGGFQKGRGLKGELGRGREGLE